MLIIIYDTRKKAKGVRFFFFFFFFIFMTPHWKGFNSGRYSQINIPEGIDDKHYVNFSLYFKFSALGLHQESNFKFLKSEI